MMKIKNIKVLLIVGIFISAGFLWLEPISENVSGAGKNSGFRTLIDKKVTINSRSTGKYLIRKTGRGSQLSMLVSLTSPGELGPQETLTVTLRDGQRVVSRKALHAGDPDLYVPFKAGVDTGEIEISSASVEWNEVSVKVLEWEKSVSNAFAIESEPNDVWREANEIKIGQTVWASADDKPYIQAQSEETARQGIAPYQQIQDAARDLLPEGGVDWFKFDYDGAQPGLVHFELNLLERDNIPVDVSIFTISGNEVRPYERGADPVTPPHEVQALPGNKFTTRILTKGTYFVRVDANHVFYQLKTSLYDLPPYNEPRKAVRAGMDYIVSAGDSWHANIPRHGGLVTRVSSNHHETMLCIACHATHFTTRAELTAARNGYQVNKRASLDFLVERLSNNPLPLYGHREAYWTRVISASANVMSRLAMLVNQYDSQFTGQKRISLLRGVGGYLKLYYKDRTELPNDESNGNTPLVSAYEVAWYSWKVLDELGRRKVEPEYAQYRDLVRKLIDQDKIKNNVDLCYQTLAMIEIDRAAFAEKIKRNAERMLSLQRPDGQWSLLFDKDSPAVEFQTYHCLYTLARAGYSAEESQISKSLKFLLSRQQEWGGWFDPLQSYENFRTPFRETQFAIMALSEFYKSDDEVKKKGSAGRSTNDLLQRLQRIDSTVSQPVASPAALVDTRQLIAELGSEEPMMRMAAAAALGRIGAKDALAPLSSLLGDPAKLVQIAASQAIRRIASRDQAGAPQILAALNSRSERTRWGATRIFAQHFSYLAPKKEYAERLLGMLKDPYVLARMQAAKSLVQWFYWAKDVELKDRIADAFIAGMAINEHPWMRRNLLEGFYSLADENVRYLYNNWIGHLPQKVDRDTVTAAHRDESRKMAERIARGLETGNELQRDGLLRSLTEFHLRSGGYANAGRYTRIGNDVETVVFYADGAPALERALMPLLESNDPKRRQQALLASYTMRDNNLFNLPVMVMEKLTDQDAGVRSVAEEFYRSLPLTVVEQNRRQAVNVLGQLLSSDFPEAQIAALDRIKNLGDDRGRFDSQIRSFILNSNSKVAPAAWKSLAEFPQLAGDAEIQAKFAAALQDRNEPLLRAAVDLALRKPGFISMQAVAEAFDTLIRTREASKRKLILNLINAETPAANDSRVTNLIAASLDDRDESVRSAALNAVRRVKSLQSDMTIRDGIAKLMKDPNQRLQALALEIYQGQEHNTSLDLAANAERMLDFRFFSEKVMPVLARKGPDGNACVNCHVTHTIFKLVEPDNQGRFTDAQIRENYRYALKVVDLANPENSLILRKPTSDSSVEGIAGAKRTAHGGGIRWPATTGDPAYQTLLEWINGARLLTEQLKK
ncbi:MAG: HEAT repeat domain-containing protein [Acidobacteria bacterium]|nr:HEAT repeat domain-containing protein [Acidobacteriota bacterium]